MIQGTENLINLIEEKEIVDLVSSNTIQGASIDLRIGETAKIRTDNKPLMLSENPDLESIYKEVSLVNGFCLKPNQYLYANTIEYVKIPNDMCGILLSRSTLARLGLITPMSQYANPSYEGHLPIIIFNASNVDIEIPPYYKIIQLLLCKVDGKAKEYNQQFDTKYYKETNIPAPKIDIDYDIEKTIKELQNATNC